MNKERGVLALLVLLISVLSAWAALSTIRPLETSAPMLAQSDTQQHDVGDGIYTLSHTLIVHHAQKQKTESFSGNLTLPACDTFSTNAETTFGNPSHLSLSFNIAKASTTCTSTASSSAPFLVALSKVNNEAAVVDAIMVNGASASYSIVDDQR